MDDGKDDGASSTYDERGDQQGSDVEDSISERRKKNQFLLPWIPKLGVSL
jgi:hypothetical protein